MQYSPRITLKKYEEPNVFMAKNVYETPSGQKLFLTVDKDKLSFAVTDVDTKEVVKSGSGYKRTAYMQKAYKQALVNLGVQFTPEKRKTKTSTASFNTSSKEAPGDSATLNAKGN